MLTTRSLGTQGLRVSSLGLGLMGMSFAYGADERDEGESIATIHRAIELGVTFFDTAEAYGPFENERLLARALASFKGKRDHLVIATKVGFSFDEQGTIIGVNSRPSHIREAVEGSLERLETDHIDLLYQHRVDPEVPIEDAVGAMADAVHPIGGRGVERDGEGYAGRGARAGEGVGAAVQRTSGRAGGSVMGEAQQAGSLRTRVARLALARMRRSRCALIPLVPFALAACAASTTPSPPLATSASFWPAHPVGAVHTLMPSPTTVVYGGYDPAAVPVLRVASGDEVIVGAVSTCGARLLQPGVDTGTIEPAYRAIVAAVRDSTLRRGPGGHILTGPIYIDGAEPGDVLEVRIESIAVDLPYACNAFGPRGGFLPEDFPGASRFRVIPLDLQHMVARFSDSLGITIPLHPFFGSIGVAPSPERGRINSAPPGTHAGNLDNKELVAGTILYIPVHTRGALLEIGDGHAGQGDGEVDITALETALRGRFQLIVRKELHFDWPRGETPTAWIAMGTDSSLTVATKIATRQAIALLGDTYHLSREDAYQLLSTGADVRITQLVDGTMGAHVVIPKRLFAKQPRD